MKRALLSALLLVLVAPGAQAECIAIVNPDPLVRLRYSKHVYLAEVIEAAGDVATAKILRSWRGKGRTVQWRGALGVRAGQYYLVYGQSDPELFNWECDIMPMPLERARRDITMLDRYRGFPPLVLPTGGKDKK